MEESNLFYIVLSRVKKADFEGKNGLFLYFYNICHKEETHTIYNYV